MRRRIAPLLIAFTLIATVSCSVPDSAFADFLTDMNSTRQRDVTSPWTASDKELFFQSYIASDGAENSSFSVTSLQGLCTPGPEREITPSQLTADIETLFQLLRETYGAYFYFGGDQSFGRAKELLLAEVQLMSKDAKLTSKTIESLLTTYLSPIVKDSHFVIGTTRMLADCQADTYYVPYLYFDSILAGYGDYMAPTITPEGTLKYAFIALSKDSTALPESVTVDQKSIPLGWTQMEPFVSADTPCYAVSNVDGIDVITSRTMLYMQECVEELELFARSGAEYRNAKTLIIDLRGNYGGNSAYAMSWLQNFLGTEFQVKQIYAQRISAPLRYYANSPNSIYDPAFSAWLKDQRDPWVTQILEGAQHKNNCILFVLVDQNVASAAEDFIAWLRSTENVLIVGTNTSGTSVCGNICYFYLPNSKLMIRFGTSLTFYDRLENRDGVGFLPDLWVDPSVSLDYLLNLCKNSGLARSVP